MTDNTIQALRKVQWGLEGVKATGTLTLPTQPTAGDTLTIGAVVYTFVAVVDFDTAGEISIGADLAGAKTNIVAAINGTDGVNDPNPYASAAAFIGDVSTITARLPGPAGDAIVFTETFTAVGNVLNGGGTLGGSVAGTMARGTAVAATSIVALENFEWDDSDENIYRPSIANGLLMRNRGRATAVQHGTRFNFSDQPVVWEQFMHWLAMSVSGEPVVTGPAGGPYVWTFTSNPATNPNPASFTFERRFSNGLGNNVDQRAAYAMIEELTLRFAANEHLRMSGKGFARKFATNAITGALTMPDPELGVSALSKVYVNDAWADVGNTLLAEQVIGWELAFGTGLFPRPTAEGRTDLDFTKHQLNGNERKLSFKLTILLDPTTYAAEAAKAAAGDNRAVRVRVTGSGGRQLDVDMLLQYSKPSLFKIGEDQGQDIVEIELEEATDNTNFLRVALTHPDVYSLA